MFIAAESPDAVPVRRSTRRRVAFALVWLLTLAVVAAAIDAGLRLRRWTWDHTTPIHFVSDITNGYRWGRRANGPEGWANQYDKMARQTKDTGNFLDYAPLRLLVMRQWVRHNADTQSDPARWRPAYEFHRPVLRFNAAIELVGVAAAFFFVRRWVRVSYRRVAASPAMRSDVDLRSDAERRTGASQATRLPQTRPLRPPLPPFCGWPQGLLAAGLLWFNPAMILSAHAWPTWDAWVVPPFLLALLAASYRRWFWAGAALGIGVMLKGQSLVGLPVFFAWTLLNGDVKNALRLTAGLLVAVAAVASPWLTMVIPPAKLAALYEGQAGLTDSTRFPKFVVDRVWNMPAIVWAVAMADVAVALPMLRRLRSRRLRWGAVALAAVIALCPLGVRPGFGAIAEGMKDTAGLAVAVASGSVSAQEFTVAAAAAVTSVRVVAPVLAVVGFIGFTLIALHVRRRTDVVMLVAATAAVSLLAGVYFFDSSAAWWTVGVVYGSDHYQNMVMGMTDSLPALLHQRFGWRSLEAVVFTWDRTPVTIRHVTRGLFVLLLLPCLWAVARHARSGDRRLLVAVVAPWVVFFLIPAQIHERYLIYAAAVSCVWAGQGLGMTLLGLYLTAETFKQMLHVMLTPTFTAAGFGQQLHEWRPEWFSPQSGLTLHGHLSATHPDIAWANLLALAVILYMAVTRTPRLVPSPAYSRERGPDAHPLSVGRSTPDHASSQFDGTSASAQNASDGGNPSGRNAAEQR